MGMHVLDLARKGTEVAPAQPSWLVNAKVVDVVSGQVSVGRNVEMVDGRVRSISSALPPAQQNVTDVEGRFVLPGLISCHTHLSVVFPMSSTGSYGKPGGDGIAGRQTGPRCAGGRDNHGPLCARTTSGRLVAEGSKTPWFGASAPDLRCRPGPYDAQRARRGGGVRGGRGRRRVLPGCS